MICHQPPPGNICVGIYYWHHSMCFCSYTANGWPFFRSLQCRKVAKLKNFSLTLLWLLTCWAILPRILPDYVAQMLLILFWIFFNENLSVRCDCTLKSDGADKKSLVPIPIGTSYSIAGALRVKKFSISISSWMVDRCMLLTRVLKGGEKKTPNFSIHLQIYLVLILAFSARVHS